MQQNDGNGGQPFAGDCDRFETGGQSDRWRASRV
jgi:hypothetical protein